MRTPGGRTPFSGTTATPPPALTSPHNPNPGKRQHQEKPRSEELQFLLLPAEATAHLQTHVQGRARGEGMVAEHPPCMPWDAARSFLESLLLLYLICHRVLVGVSLLAAHVLVHRGDNLQDVVVRGKGCAPGRKGKDTLALRERSRPTEQFKVGQVTKKGVSLRLISVTKLRIPHLCPLFRTLSGTWVTPEAAHHFCRTTTHPGFGLLAAS